MAIAGNWTDTCYRVVFFGSMKVARDLHKHRSDTSGLPSNVFAISDDATDGEGLLVSRYACPASVDLYDFHQSLFSGTENQTLQVAQVVSFSSGQSHPYHEHSTWLLVYIHGLRVLAHVGQMALVRGAARGRGFFMELDLYAIRLEDVNSSSQLRVDPAEFRTARDCTPQFPTGKVSKVTVSHQEGQFFANGVRAVLRALHHYQGTTGHCFSPL